MFEGMNLGDEISNLEAKEKFNFLLETIRGIDKLETIIWY
jgi:hypothetical protein